jgi:predicted nucleic acid-binding protein
MTAPPVVSNSSAIIALEQIGHLALLRLLFAEILIPPGVSQETAPSVVLPVWIVEQPLSQSVGPRILQASLGRGESEAISLALEVTARWVILDDRPARRLTQSLSLSVIGTLGVLLAAKRRGSLSALRPCVDALADHGFHIAPDLRDRILADAGEAQ